ncbi:MAG: glycosyltransferase [Pseudomonadota bacterium]|nr:glycosyltransferase [Pseudomonadota bacterium]
MSATMDPKPLTASLVIVTVNRADSLERTLASLNQIRYPHFEVVVVNGPSTDHTAEVIARHAGKLRAYSTDQSNISVSRNIGLAHARGDIVAFIDDDAVPEPDWLENLLRPYADPEVITVGGFIRDTRGFEFQARYTVCDRFGDVRQYRSADEFKLEGEQFLSLTGTNFSARRDNLLALGGFDEEYIWFLDETDVNLRMHDRGWRFAVAPDAEIHHKYEAGLTRTRSAAPRTMYPQLRSKAYFCVRHNLGRRPLADVLGYIADYVGKERDWKRGLAHDGVDQATIDRLIGEVERGVEDGVADALRLTTPALLSPATLAPARHDSFQPFPLTRPAPERLRICLLSREYPPQGHGGIAQWTREVAVGLAARGHEVSVIARALDGPKGIDFVEGVWVHRVDPAPITQEEAAAFAPAPASLSAYSLALFREYERIDARRRFDVVSGPIADLEPMVCLARAPTPVIVSLHTTYKLSLPYKPDWLSRPDYLAGHVEPAIVSEGELMTKGPHILANSRTIVADIEAAHALKIDPARIEIVPHGISDLSLEAPAAVEPDGQVHLLFVGRLEERKGADALLAQLPGLLAAHPTLVAHIVGDDGIVIDDTTLRRRYEIDNSARPDILARTRFYGALSREGVIAQYAACDIFIAPSKYESFGLIFIEAMCFGKPTVAYGVGGAAELIRDGVDGLLASPDAPAELAACVSRLVDDPALREAIGRNARATYESCYTTELMLDRLEAYYRRVAGKDVVTPAAQRRRA